MSSVTGNPGKGEKSKKFRSLNINTVFQAAAPKPQQRTLPQKHGLQSLGKVPSARRAPINLPSVKAENSGNDTNASQVSSGWSSEQSIPPQPQTEVANNGSTPQGLKPHTTELSRESTPGHTQQFIEEFPSLESAVSGEIKAKSHHHSHQQQESGIDKHGSGPNLRPQTHGNWSQGGKQQSGVTSDSLFNRDLSIPPPPLGIDTSEPPPPIQRSGGHETFRFDVSSETPLRFLGGQVLPRRSSPQLQKQETPSPRPTRTSAGARPGSKFTTSTIIDEEKLKRMDDIDTYDDDWTNRDEAFDYNKKIDSDEEDNSIDQPPTNSWADQLTQPPDTSTLRSSDTPSQFSNLHANFYDEDESVRAKRNGIQQNIERARKRREEEDKRFRSSESSPHLERSNTGQSTEARSLKHQSSVSSNGSWSGGKSSPTQKQDHSERNYYESRNGRPHYEYRSQYQKSSANIPPRFKQHAGELRQLQRERGSPHLEENQKSKEHDTVHQTPATSEPSAEPSNTIAEVSADHEAEKRISLEQNPEQEAEEDALLDEANHVKEEAKASIEEPEQSNEKEPWTDGEKHHRGGLRHSGRGRYDRGDFSHREGHRGGYRGTRGSTRGTRGGARREGNRGRHERDDDGGRGFEQIPHPVDRTTPETRRTPDTVTKAPVEETQQAESEGWFAPRGEPSRRGRGGISHQGSSRINGTPVPESKTEESLQTVSKRTPKDDVPLPSMTEEESKPQEDSRFYKAGRPQAGSSRGRGWSNPQTKRAAYERRQVELPPRLARQKNRSKFYRDPGTEPWNSNETGTPPVPESETRVMTENESQVETIIFENKSLKGAEPNPADCDPHTAQENSGKIATLDGLQIDLNFDSKITGPESAEDLQAKIANLKVGWKPEPAPSPTAEPGFAQQTEESRRAHIHQVQHGHHFSQLDAAKAGVPISRMMTPIPGGLPNQQHLYQQSFTVDQTRSLPPQLFSGEFQGLNPQSLLMHSPSGNGPEIFGPPPNANRFRLPYTVPGQFPGQQLNGNQLLMSQGMAIKNANQIGPIGTKATSPALLHPVNALTGGNVGSHIMIPYSGAQSSLSFMPGAGQTGFYQNIGGANQGRQSSALTPQSYPNVQLVNTAYPQQSVHYLKMGDMPGGVKRPEGHSSIEGKSTDSEEILRKMRLGEAKFVLENDRAQFGRQQWHQENKFRVSPMGQEFHGEEVQEKQRHSNFREYEGVKNHRNIQK